MELNLDQKVVVKNLCSWELGFPRLDSSGDVHIPQRGVTRLTRGEIQSQVHANNIMFVGVDGKGSHARILIDDQDTRIMFGFEEEDGKSKQLVFDAAAAKALMELEPFTKFEKEVKTKVITQPEKLLLVEEAKRLKLNDLRKVQFIESYTGFTFDQLDKDKK